MGTHKDGHTIHSGGLVVFKKVITQGSSIRGEKKKGSIKRRDNWAGRYFCTAAAGPYRINKCDDVAIESNIRGQVP
jgi:hypothetical protein